MALDELVWNHSTFTVNRDQLFNVSVMWEFFGGVVKVAEWAELTSDEHFYVDGSLLRAWASHKSLAEKDDSGEPPARSWAQPGSEFPWQEARQRNPCLALRPWVLLATETPGGPT